MTNWNMAAAGGCHLIKNILMIELDTHTHTRSHTRTLTSICIYAYVFSIQYSVDLYIHFVIVNYRTTEFRLVIIGDAAVEI